MDTILVRAAADAFQKADKDKIYMFRREEDGTRAFIPETPLHLVNEASVDDLREKAMKKYSGSDAEAIKIDAASFRPNIVVRSEVPYEEDKFGECRIHNIFIRYTSHTKRDEGICGNSKTGKYNNS